MSSLDVKVIVHRLNMDLNGKANVQQKRMFALERQKVISEEVERLKSTNFVKEVQLPT